MDFLLYFDFYAPKPTLFIKNQDSVKTYLGSILSLITIVFLALILIYIILCFINDTGLTVLHNKSSKDINNIDLNLSQRIFFYSLNNKNGQIIDKRLIRTYPYLTIKTSRRIRYELLKEINCDINKMVKINREYKNLIKFDISEYNCITYQNDTDAIIQIRSNPIRSSYINLFVSKCHNDTNLNISDCFPEQEINDFIENNSLFVNVFLESTSIDHQNFNHPLTKKYYKSSLIIPKDFFFSYSFFWRKIEYYTRNSFLLFKYIFQNSSFILDTKIKDKEIYSTNEDFYVNKTLGRIQFSITEEYTDFYVRKYKTILDSLTILMTGFNIITNACTFFNYLFTKSYIYCTIFEPIITNSKSRTFFEHCGNNATIYKHFNASRNNDSLSNSPSLSKIELVKDKNLNLNVNNTPILKINNKTFPLKKNPSFPELSDMNFDPMKTFFDKEKEDIYNILNDIHTKKISHKVNFSDKLLFVILKLIPTKNKKQMYLQRIENLLHEELSLDYLFQEFKTIKFLLCKDLKRYQTDKWNTLSKNKFSINVSSINNM